MSRLGKLYKYYLGKIFRQNWLRIALITLIVVVGWWFVYPYLLYRTNKSLMLKELHQEQSTNETENQVEQWTFHDWSKVLFGKEVKTKVRGSIFERSREEFLKLNREELVEKIQELKEAKREKDEKQIKKLAKEISKRTMVDRSLAIYFDSPWKADTIFFFCQTEDYKSEKPFLKLLNNISWWNLTGTIALFWLFFNTLDNIFFKPQKNREENLILNFNPGVKRSDLFWSKTLAFLTFYFIMNVLLFLLPFGFYYWWAGVKPSFSWFSLLALWTTIIGPLLFFSLIFVPYLFLKSKISWLDWIFSALLSFFPTLCFLIKSRIPAQTWLWSVENWFFNLVWFIPISLITGIVFGAFYCWHYENQDLGN